MSTGDPIGWKLLSPLPLLAHLLDAGWRVIGPQARDGAIVYAPVESPEDLPQGLTDAIAPGRYRVEPGDPCRWFDYVVGPQGWKRWLMPPRAHLGGLERQGDGFRPVPSQEVWPETAFFGVRPCDLAALGILDIVHEAAGATQHGYADRRAHTLIVAVQCARSAPTCFCASMGTGPQAEDGFDLAMTELPEGGLLLRAGSERGRRLAMALDAPEATAEDLAAAGAATRRAADAQTRRMPPRIGGALAAAPEAPHWDDVAQRCLACANCTLACPTCFCTDVAETNDLAGEHTDRWLVWDSCFNLDFSYIHGGLIRTSVKSRYHQWMTHKLSSWHAQFGTSGCVGCGRCIAWCPVGIDITEEAARFATAETEAALP